MASFVIPNIFYPGETIYSDEVNADFAAVATAINSGTTSISGLFNVLSYGAYGDGSHDDTNAIQATITAASVNGGIVFLPGGTYLVSSTLNIPSGVSVCGVSWSLQGSVIRPNFNGNLFNTSAPCNGLSFYNFCVNPVTTPTSGAIFRMSQVSNVRIDQILVVTAYDVVQYGTQNINECQQVYVTNCTFGGQVGPITHAFFRFSGVSGGHVIENVECTGNGTTTYAILFDAISYTDPLFVKGVDFEACAYGIYGIGQFTVENADFDSVIVDASSVGGAVLFDPATATTIDGFVYGIVEQITFSNCWLTTQNDGSPTFYLYGNQTATSVAGNFYIQVTNCNIINVSAGTVNASALQIANGADTIIISNCIIIGNTSAADIAIELNGTGVTTTNITITGCQLGSSIQESSAYGVLVSCASGATMKNITVTGNTITNTVNPVSIQNAGTVTGVSIVGNNCVGNSNTIANSGTITNMRIADNNGVNPIGVVTSPSVATSGTAVTNSTGYDCDVNINSGAATISAIAINGTALTGVTMASSTNRQFFVGANGTITLTYSGGTPTWQWIGH